MSTDVRYCANDDCAEEVEANCKWCKECSPVPEKLKAVIVPGNGCVPVEASNWYLWAQQELTKTGLFPGGVLLPTMPDAHKARRNIWIPFLLEHCKVDKNTVLIGHSSGAECGMRLLEKQRLAGVVLVAACHTDLEEISRATRVRQYHIIIRALRPVNDLARGTEESGTGQQLSATRGSSCNFIAKTTALSRLRRRASWPLNWARSFLSLQIGIIFSRHFRS